MARALILFDIDGTLMITKGATTRCLRQAGRALFGDGFEWRAVTAGMLDGEIFAQLAEHNGIEDAAAHQDAFRARYLAELERVLTSRADDVTVLPGVQPLLAALHERAQRQGDLTLGLLSGNYRRAAELKLAAAGIAWDWFPVTVLGEDGTCRDDLPAVAMRRHKAATGEAVAAERVVIVGDTPRDVACAAANGCHVIAVATGRYDEAALRAAGAQHVLPDLSTPVAMALVLRCADLTSEGDAAPLDPHRNAP